MFPQLKKLHIHAPTSHVPDTDIELLSQALPKLTDVFFHRQLRLTSVALTSVARHLPAIQRLSLFCCKNICNTGVIAVAKKCAQLTVLDVSFCTNITDTVVREVWQHCVMLQELNVHGCALVTDAAFAQRINASIRVLNLRDCLLFSLGSLAACHNLKSLVLNKCPNITNESLLESLNGCTALEDFVVVDCNAVDSRSVSGVLNQVPRLASIQFCATFDRSFHLASVLTNLVPKPTAYLYTLSVILTPNCTACSTTLRQLATHFPQLQKLHLDGDDPANRVTDADIAFLCTNCPHLVNLSLQRFAHLSSVALQSIALYLPLLQRLRVAHCHKICNEGVIALARGCGRLKSLSLAYCGYVTDEAVREVLLLCTQLEKLDLRTCARVSDAAFAERSTTTLRILDVSQTWVQGAFIEQISTIVRLKCDDCLNLNTTFVRSIASHPNIIQHLSLDETELCAADILTLSTHLPHLQSVNLSSSKADDAVVRSLVTNCPRLRYVNVSDCSVTKDLVGEVKRLYQDRLKIYW
eukprot:gene12124-14049_t